MVANTLLEIYTLIFGWNMYGAIWDVLTGSGLAFIPFIAAIVSNFKESYSDGNPDSTIKDLEIRVGSMILVLLLCVLPYKGWGIQLSTVQYSLNVPDCNPPANVQGQGNNTGTEFDNAFAGMAGMQVYKPVLWSFVEFVSSAVTHTTIKSMACVNNYEFMLMRISQISIQDPKLKQRIREFHEVCYKKALERYEINPVPVAGLGELEDIDWIGSRTFVNYQDEYYRHPDSYMANLEMYGFQRQTVTRKSDLAHASGAHPYCNEVWLGEQGAGIVNPALGLRELILKDIPVDQAGSILNDWMNWGSEVVTVGTATNDDKEDLIIKLILEADVANLKSQTEVDLTNKLDTEKGWFKEAVDSFFAGAGILSSVDDFLTANTMKQMVKIAGPMLIALIQMVIIMASPFVVLLGHYRISSFVSVALAYFSFEFVNAIWAAAFWFDNKVLDIYISQAGWLDVATNSFLIMAVSTGSIILLPGIWLSLLAYSGAGMIRGMGMGGVGGGSAAGSQSFGRGARGIGTDVYRMNEERKRRKAAKKET